MNKILLLIFISLVLLVNKSSSLQCYKCVSMDGSDIECEMGRRSVPYHNPCHIGTSDKPGNRCIKITGVVNIGYDRRTVLIRDCTDKTYYKGEPIEFEQQVISGRAYTCKSNLCNSSSALLNRYDLIKFTIFVLFIVFSIHKLL